MCEIKEASSEEDMLIYGCLISHLITFDAVVHDGVEGGKHDKCGSIENTILEKIQTTTIEELRSQVIDSICSLVIIS